MGDDKAIITSGARSGTQTRRSSQAKIADLLNSSVERNAVLELHPQQLNEFIITTMTNTAIKFKQKSAGSKSSPCVPPQSVSRIN